MVNAAPERAGAEQAAEEASSAGRRAERAGAEHVAEEASSAGRRAERESAEHLIDVLCLGEALVDLLPDRRGRLRECEGFTAHSGGAPANVAVGVARLGGRVAMSGVLGDDEFGHLLLRKLAAEGIDCRFRMAPKAPTGIWFVSVDDQGNRSFFSPTGGASADKRLGLIDVLKAPIAKSRWLHTGTSCHLLPEAQEALVRALRTARTAGVRTSHDPNVRLHLWRDAEAVRALCERVFPLCDLVKLSDEESETCLGEADPERALARLVEEFGVRLACVTLGSRGAIARRGTERFQVAAPQVAVVDTTGAGDGFVAGLLSQLTAPGAPTLEDFPAARLEAALRFACAVGSRVCTQLGAVGGLPRAAEIDVLETVEAGPRPSAP
jgi:fructokinase